ncbi:MAG: molybdate ABC transporter substrate-binding protein [Acidobacteriaceae bacterium]|nr:molybdate ABC transporter substrate-binding protein [Acidobacteriaceae bacterium]MBV9780959.1 molybdate ABC transporter substrate-binding protein [Acidobacteriaceae bacterium]
MSLQLSSSQETTQPTLTVAAAADLAPLEPELASNFEKTNPIRIKWVTGASAILSQNIENGAPYDVLLSANAQFVDRLSSFRKIDPASVKVYALGRLGILWKDGKRHPIKNLKENWVRFVALPNPKLAPYGVAAEETLKHAGVWEFVSQKVVYGENVRQTLQLFESGNADAVLTSNSLLQGKNAEVIPDDWHKPIVQKCGIVAESKNLETARKFADFLTSAAGEAIFAKFGFASGPTPSGAPDRKRPVNP